MFVTFRHNQDKDSLDAVRETTDPPVPKGAQSDACRRCREKKLRCTGERSGCDRCLANGWQCTYPGRLRSRQNSLATTGKRKSSSTTDPGVQRSTESKRSLPRARTHSQSMTPSTCPDDSAITTANEMINFNDNSWQIEAMQIPPSPRASPELFPMDAMSSWSMLNGGHDHSFSLSGQGHIQQDATDGLAMNLDFDVDEILSMPGILSSDTRSLDASPTDRSIEMGQQTVLGAQQSSRTVITVYPNSIEEAIQQQSICPYGSSMHSKCSTRSRGLNGWPENPSDCGGPPAIPRKREEQCALSGEAGQVQHVHRMLTILGFDGDQHQCSIGCRR
ncbi:hypothetical protein BU26DRAFT_591484 [Trematosphaeria pertusa]|uniref:Zn(2)-C6 fungal-type domain-containing protein n=1 Tax=Trematosphaeria pertusa TaxID=390896 RepID=A0A6A6IM31_9PLEO|nr:uncharacterized protein BU26DRAFT_591484 [Trematosphaeria pertusa]KAF2250600.1 hypothetical protein BU26DRAFT_591484 [Trematosphaeria pertusa]